MSLSRIKIAIPDLLQTDGSLEARWHPAQRFDLTLTHSKVNPGKLLSILPADFLGQPIPVFYEGDMTVNGTINARTKENGWRCSASLKVDIHRNRVRYALTRTDFVDLMTDPFAVSAEIDMNRTGTLDFQVNIQEGDDGYLKTENAAELGLKEKRDLRALVEGKNQDRQQLYSEVAKALKIDPGDIGRIAKIFAEEWKKTAPPRY